MPWRLDIHLLDVGQGDCTLIDARHTNGQRSTLLVDGGLPRYGEFVHDYLVNTAQVPALDKMLLTHYNEDHGGGLRALLLADDLSNVVRTLTTVGAAYAGGADRPERIASTVAAVYSAALGNYGPNIGWAANASMDARQNAVGNDTAAVNTGVASATWVGSPAGVQTLVTSAARRRGVARAAGLAAAAGIVLGEAGAVLTNRIRTAILNSLRTGMQLQAARFWTGNRYNNTEVIDLGNTAMMPAGWNTTIGGQFTIAGNAAVAPTVNRNRRSNPPLGDEVLWDPAAPPANAPQAYLISRSSLAWQGIGVAPFPVATGFPDNDTSMGLLIKFNDFFYYTAGDLPSVGENPLMNALVNHGLPNPAGGGALPVVDRLGSFKCSHHGAATSTSAAFLHDANPRTALISCGYNLAYQHPDDGLVFRLHGDPGLSRFYLTNCNFQSNVVAASMGHNQLTWPGNKSRVAGDNNQNNIAAGRHRGDIIIRVTQANSQAAAGARTVTVNYWDDDQVPAGMRNSPSQF
jgi:beta-lactamase superfamily II metal-dependent hydrolase